MLFSEFIKLNEELWDQYFQKIFTKILRKEITLRDGGTLLFPNIILFTETDKHFIVELLGCSRGYNGLTTKIHKEKSTLTYLYQFDYKENDDYKNSAFHITGEKGSRSKGGMRGVLIARPVDVKNLQSRFKFINHREGSSITRTGGDGPLITFDKTFQATYLDDCVLVNNLEDIYRVKHISHLVIINKNYLKTFYVKDLKERLESPIFTTNDLYGIQYCNEKRIEDLVLSSQFTNTFLIPGLRETTIGEFINQNPNFLCEALSCDSFLYEKELEWVEGNTEPEEKTINPDIMLKRSDGFYNICDLKLPLLDKKNLTKGKHKRRELVSKVTEGLAQLANYREFFEFEKNRNLAKSKFDITVSDPELILILGNYENLDPKELREATRMYKGTKFRIIDYDSLNALYLNKKLKY